MPRMTRDYFKVLPLAFALVAGAVQATDHFDSSAAVNDPIADLLDLYAFVDPFCQASGGQGCEDDPDELILALTVNPLATGASQFSDEVDYHFYIENDLGNTSQIDCTFSPEQVVTCTGLGGLSVQARVGETVSNGDIRVFAGLRDDPSYLDLEALEEFATVGVPAFSPPGVDTLAGANVLAIVIGIKTSAFPPGSGPDHNLLKIWAASERTAGDGLNGAISGSWYNRVQDGQGWLIEVVSSPSGPDQFVVYFFGYENGEQLWLVGNAPSIVGNSATVDVFRTSGADWGDDFNTDDVIPESVGSMAFEFSDCNTATVAFTPSNGSLSAFSTSMERLSSISSMTCSLFVAGQIDRMGRPLVSTFFIPESMRDTYNAASNPGTWSAMFNDEIVAGIQALDTADGVVGNLFTGDPQVLATIFVDDRLQVDIKNGQTVGYLSNEASALVPQESFDSGGRALWYDVLDDTLSMIVSGWDPLVGDFVDANDVPFLAEFPFLAAPQ